MPAPLAQQAHIEILIQPPVFYSTHKNPFLLELKLN